MALCIEVVMTLGFQAEVMLFEFSSQSTVCVKVACSSVTEEMQGELWIYNKWNLLS